MNDSNLIFVSKICLVPLDSEVVTEMMMVMVMIMTNLTCVAKVFPVPWDSDVVTEMKF